MGYHSRLNDVQKHDMGRMNVRCTSCGALWWSCEQKAHTAIGTTFEDCCKHGKVVLQPFADPPEELQRLLQRHAFLREIRRYNLSFRFTSNSATPDRRVTGGLTMYSIHGALYHRAGTDLVPRAGQEPQYAQIYIYDPADAAAVRSRRYGDLDRAVFRELTEMLHRTNPLIRLYHPDHRILQGALNRERVQVVVDARCRLQFEAGPDRRRENLPTANEVAAIIPERSQEYDDQSFRDIVLCRKVPGDETDVFLERTHTSHPLFWPLAYPFLFSDGRNGWDWSLRLRDEGPNGGRLEHRAWHRFMLQTRDDFHLLQRCGRLFQEWLVDIYATTRPGDAPLAGA